MCKAHSKVTHIKQQNYFHHLKGRGYNKNSSSMAVSVAVCEIFSVKEWCDLENRVRVRSRSLEMAPFDRSHTSFYSPPIVTVAPSCIVCEIKRLIGRKSSNLYSLSVSITLAGGDPIGISWRCLMLRKLEWLVYHMVKELWDNMLSRFHLIPERYGQTDGRTDGQTDIRTDKIAISSSGTYKPFWFFHMDRNVLQYSYLLTYLLTYLLNFLQRYNKGQTTDNNCKTYFSLQCSWERSDYCSSSCIRILSDEFVVRRYRTNGWATQVIYVPIYKPVSQSANQSKWIYTAPWHLCHKRIRDSWDKETVHIHCTHGQTVHVVLRIRLKVLK